MWNIASITAGVAGCSNQLRSAPSRPISSGSSAIATAPVTRLKITWVAATRRAFEVAPSADRIAVEVVPMLVPITIAHAASIDISPPWAAVMMIAITAPEACISTVSRVPMPTRISQPVKPGAMWSCRFMVAPKPEKVSLSASMPRKSTPKPASAWPSARWRTVRPASIRVAPMPTKGSAKASIRKLKPSAATSQALSVVPTLEPKITHIAFCSDSSPVLTKPMLATVTAVEDCTSAVMVMPAPRPRTGVAVPRSSRPSSARPAASLRPSVSMCMPSRNRPMPPSRPATIG